MQTDPLNEFPDNGRYYCGPVAMADNLVWLSNNGFPKLAQSGLTDKQKVLEVAKILGGTNYLNVPPIGNPPHYVMSKTIEYIEDSGYEIRNSEVWGWDKIKTDISFTFTELSSKLKDDSIICLMLGKYGYDSKTDEYFSKGFHYVALAGFDEISQTLIINCPSPRSGMKSQSEICSVKTLNSGIINVKIPTIHEFKKSASGTIKLEGLKWQRESEVILLHGYINIVLCGDHESKMR
jgi:hypothetical protein